MLPTRFKHQVGFLHPLLSLLIFALFLLILSPHSLEHELDGLRRSIWPWFFHTNRWDLAQDKMLRLEQKQVEGKQKWIWSKNSPGTYETVTVYHIPRATLCINITLTLSDMEIHFLFSVGELNISYLNEYLLYCNYHIKVNIVNMPRTEPSFCSTQKTAFFIYIVERA